MTAKLCILCCQNFRPEIEAAVAAENWQDVDVAAFPVRCGRPPVNWDELRPLVTRNHTQVLILGRACLQGLSTPPEGWPPVRQAPQQECFHLVAGATLVAEAIARGGYLITPAWLDDWRGNMRRQGFDEQGAAGFFRDFARELVLLDTGVVPDVSTKLAELATVVDLPATRTAVGIDYTRLLLARLVAEWHLDDKIREREHGHARERADYMSAMDFLGRLALLKDETETVAAIEELFRMLFAPEEFHYIRIDNGIMACDDALSPDLSRQARTLAGDWAWTESGSGFLLRVDMAGNPLGIIVVDHFAFPDSRDRYLNLALSIAGVCGLAIENARTYRRIKEVDEALQALNATLEQRVTEEVAKNMAHERLLIQQSRLAAMGEMIGYIAHQWRQPLNALSILIANIRDEYEFHELTQESLDQSVKRALGLLQGMSATIDDFRDFFKPNKEKSVFSLDLVVQDVLDILGSSLSHHNIEVTHAIAKGIRISGFPNELAQVVLNIVNNAKEAILSSGHRGGLIDIGAERDNDRVRLAVRNNGGCIPDDVLPSIFDAYFTTKEKGSGIGLYMSKLIVETHLQGKIEARNIPDGAEFVITCPLAQTAS